MYHKVMIGLFWIIPWPGSDSASTNLMQFVVGSNVSPVSAHFQYSKTFNLNPTSSVSIIKPFSSLSSLKSHTRPIDLVPWINLISRLR